MGIFSSIQHLLPRSEAFKLTSAKWVTKLWQGLGAASDDAKHEIDLGYLDLFPASTRELEEWERFYGLTPAPSENDRRAALAAEWQSTGGQSPSYIQGVLQTAGFGIWIHEWWASSGPYVARDPHDYTEDALIGSIQCSPYQPDTLQATPANDAQCDRFLQNDPRYWSNLDLNPGAPPPIPTDPTKYPYFLYFAGATFPDPALIEASRSTELKKLIQKLKPSQNWVVLIAEYIGPDYILVDDDGYILVDEDGYILVTT